MGLPLFNADAASTQSSSSPPSSSPSRSSTAATPFYSVTIGNERPTSSARLVDFHTQLDQLPSSVARSLRGTIASSSSSQGQVSGPGAGANTGAGLTREKTEAELEADRLYEEAMEEQYARMEGGA